MWSIQVDKPHDSECSYGDRDTEDKLNVEMRTWEFAGLRRCFILGDCWSLKRPEDQFKIRNASALLI
jgi:hypothetical protein